MWQTRLRDATRTRQVTGFSRTINRIVKGLYFEVTKIPLSQQALTSARCNSRTSESYYEGQSEAIPLVEEDSGIAGRVHRQGYL